MCEEGSNDIAIIAVGKTMHACMYMYERDGDVGMKPENAQPSALLSISLSSTAGLHTKN